MKYPSCKTNSNVYSTSTCSHERIFFTHLNTGMNTAIAESRGSAKNRPRARGGAAGARSESCSRGTGAVYDAFKGSCQSVAGGGGAFVAPAPLCAISRAFVLYRAMRSISAVPILSPRRTSKDQTAWARSDSVRHGDK